MDEASPFWEVLPILVFACVTLWELAAPRRAYQRPDGRRWGCNLSLLLANSAALGLAVAWLGVVSFAPRVALLRGSPAAFSAHPALAGLLAGASFVLIDLAGYWLHRLYHRLPILWRFHEVHHSDVGLDCTTGVRHHIAEIALTMALLQTGALLLGMPAIVLAAYGGTLLIAQIVQHSNTYWPAAIERAVGRICVTPRFHAVHHLDDPRWFNSNFGMVFTVWDRCFGTLRMPAPSGENSGLRGAPFVAWRGCVGLGARRASVLQNGAFARRAPAGAS